MSLFIKLKLLRLKPLNKRRVKKGLEIKSLTELYYLLIKKVNIIVNKGYRK
jgi:hypothetical protein